MRLTRNFDSREFKSRDGAKLPRSYLRELRQLCQLNLPGLKGAAADVRCARGTPRQWYAFLDRLDPGGLGLYVGHVHVDNRSGRARW